MCETSPKKEREKIKSSAWNSAKTDNCTKLPSNVHIAISDLKYLCAKYTFFYSHRGEKIGDIGEHEGPQPPKEGKTPTPQPQDVKEGEVYELGEIVTTTDDVDVVKEETHFTSASACVLIGEIMVCNCDLQKIKEDINDVEKRLKNIIDVLGRI
ncbi:hypothetical protein AB205_0078130 [Aquarana catesbeiana]|uniref:Uncharacterized protein n=1 Tax=Aquarana catesbeiana TaxID=8400 RepID=A0A2G9QLJ7_AQUCT|nr:hypothetical protein AB205_0078130 [Aquarana catesbeiana]